MAELAGKGALVTGGTTGLGLAIAEAFCREGARVVITGRDEALGLSAHSRLSSLGQAHFIAADAADPEAVIGSVERSVELLGGLDVLVNNAGVGLVAGVLETPLEAFDQVMAVNLRGAFVYAKAAFPHLEASSGCMIHMASDAGVMGEAEISIYSVSKAALIMLSNMLAIEAGRRGVRSNALCPGDIAPGMRHMTRPKETSRSDDPSTWPIPPLGRVGRAEDVARAAVFLASDGAAFVNGVALLIDGGMRAGMRTAREPDGRARSHFEG
jgi:NAD(P)-dependent dehydrogenase (short-subunit alcohol dehydrogenase family)